MNEIFEKFDRIEQLSGKKKQLKLKELVFQHEELEQYLRIVFNDVKYGINKKTLQKTFDDYENYFDIGELCYKNANGVHSSFDSIIQIITNAENNSGNKQIELLKDLKLLTPLTAKYTGRLLLHNLHNGISMLTVNKVFKSLGKPEIEKFGVQLCGGFPNVDDPKITEKVGYPMIACIKYDGFRVILEKTGDKIKLTSRQGKNIDYVPDLVAQIVKEFAGQSFILDGEIMCNDFATIQKRIGRKAENIEPIENLHFRVFDILKREDHNMSEEFQFDRTSYLEHYNGNSIKAEVSKWINNHDELKEFCQKAFDNHEEGIILKNINEVYKKNSRDRWFKIKQVIENTFEVIGYKLGTGKYKDTIGAILVTDGRKAVTSYVGSGLSDDDREYFFDKLINNKGNKIFVDVKFNEITIAQNGNKSLRHARLLKIRDDKEKADIL